MDSLQNSDVALPAENLEQILKNFNPQLIITEKYQSFYVDIFGSLLTKLKNSILYTDFPSQTYFITGQVGSGKTSALLKLERDLDGLKHSDYHYVIVHIDSRDFDPQDVDIEDLLIITGFKILEKIDDKKLTDRFLKDLNKLQEIKASEEYEEIEDRTNKLSGQGSLEVDINAPVLKKIDFVKLGFDAVFKLKYDSEFRRQVRIIYRLVQFELFKKINSIIEEVYKKYPFKRIILIYDDTEKLKGKNAENLFTINLNLLTDLKSIKIILFPIKYRSYIVAQKYNLTPLLFTLRLTQPPEYKEKEDAESKNNRKLLKEIILKRISAQHIDKIIEDKDRIVDKVIDNSGGNLRQLIAIVYNAAMEAIDSDKLTDSHVDSAIKALRQTFSFVLKDKFQIDLAYGIIEKHIPIVDSPTLDKAFEELLHNNLIFFYSNDDIWFAVNPIIKETIIRRYKLMHTDE